MYISQAPSERQLCKPHQQKEILKNLKFPLDKKKRCDIINKLSQMSREQQRVP